MAHELAAEPVPVANINEDFARKIYKRAQQLDEWDGEAYEGSSVLGAVKAAQELGKITEYRWAFGIQDVILTLSWHGPVVLGINWYEGMFKPNMFGYIKPSGKVMGGHAILARGYSRWRNAILLRNSWGKGWGKGGDCWIKVKDLEKLLNEQGEACVPLARVL